MSDSLNHLNKKKKARNHQKAGIDDSYHSAVPESREVVGLFLHPGFDSPCMDDYSKRQT
ncbi:MAG: hypothetical protein AB1512_13395 [Thermodesulfobacteriota bacterium]